MAVSINGNGSVSGSPLISQDRPVFWAYATGGSATSTLNTPIPFNDTKTNVGGHYNTGNYRFTAPVSGVYSFDGMLLFRKQGTTASGEWSFYVNGTNVSSRGVTYAGYSNADSQHFPASSNYITYLNQGDYVDMRIFTISVAGADFYYGQMLAHFSGFLLG